MKKVYIAGPYTHGDQAANVRRMILFADKLAVAGHAAHIPLLNHFWHIIEPHEYEFWMEQDRAWLECCDVFVRLSGESPGADQEFLWALGEQMPTYTQGMKDETDDAFAARVIGGLE